ncbi:uncharacterized protein LOC130778472 [Actinidia eriantha]|uniref:uncharacterized protein LOC130778472 n=1 Tax=Actinidia eriantha TaxID=165200 RepID=UPI002583FC51|nr:uncharacterized protein LOC130778472 [Actinidia eriantha]XP_057492958.1 uncharacterized protein LOC130778472 [Actinidia eriantha]
MGKGKNKSRKGGHRSATKEDVDPILAADSGSRGGAVGKAGPIQTKITGSSTAVKEKSVGTASAAAATATASASDLVKKPDLSADLIESLGQASEGENSEEESEDALQTLGDEDSRCTPGVRQNAQVKTVNVQCESPVSGEVRDAAKTPQGIKQSSFAGLSNHLKLCISYVASIWSAT